jgi:hypothetical protein
VSIGDSIDYDRAELKLTELHLATLPYH